MSELNTNELLFISTTNLMAQRAVTLAKPRVYQVHQSPVTPTDSGRTQSRAARGEAGPA